MPAAGKLRPVGRLGKVALRLPLHLQRSTQFRGDRLNVLGRSRVGRGAFDGDRYRTRARGRLGHERGLGNLVVTRGAVDLVERRRGRPGGGFDLGCLGVLAGCRRAQQGRERAEVLQVDVQVGLIIVGRLEARLPGNVDGVLIVIMNLERLDERLIVGRDDMHVNALDLCALGLEVAPGEVDAPVRFLIVGIRLGCQPALRLTVEMDRPAHLFPSLRRVGGAR